MPLTTAEVDRLGERLKAGRLTDEDRELLLEFRASFLPAYQEVVARIRDGPGYNPTGRPEKTPESLIAKLRRGETRLSRMQDIAGCRIVLDGRQDQDRVVEDLQILFPDTRVVDRRERPSFGYRAVHVIVRVQGRQVEVQARTSLQDRWANLVETLSDSKGVDYKHGVEVLGQERLKWLMLVAECIDRVEQDDPLPLTESMGRRDLGFFRGGQFAAVLLLTPYIQELSE